MSCLLCLLPTECLNEIFENLEDDKITLHSCLLVNRLWCKISVRILWRDIWSFKYSFAKNRQVKVSSAIISTLVSCLPNESKELLQKNEIFISTPTSKPPLFNYVSFCKVLSIYEISDITGDVLKNDKSIASQNLEGRNYLVSKEMLKMFMSQVSSLKSLTCYNYFSNNIPFTSFPGARDCLTDLSKLHCSSDINYLSQICHNLQSLAIYIESKISNELKELVSSQNNLKSLSYEGYGLMDIIPTLMKHSNTLTKLHLYVSDRVQLSFVSSFLNLQEIEFSFEYIQFVDFEKLQYVTFPKLRVLKIPYQCPTHKYLIKFLETNGKSLQELYISSDTSNLFIDKYCPNLKKLYVLIKKYKLDKLKIILNSCQYLEGIVIWCKMRNTNEKYVLEMIAKNSQKILETVAKHSPKNFCELKLYRPELFPEDLESFFVSWKNRSSKKLISLIFVEDINSSRMTGKSMEMVEKYKNLGVIKKFEIREYCKEELYL